MALPAGLRFTDRRAEDDSGAYFDCARSGHPPGQSRVRKAFVRSVDRETYITRHDALYHDELLAAQLGISRSPYLGDTVADFMQHIRDLERDGKRDSKTVKYYAGICDKLIEHFGYDTPLDSIGRKAGLDYAKRRKKSGSTSQGARFVKELKVVRRLQKFAGISVVWDVPTDDISPVHRQREAIDLGDIRDFLRAMHAGSVERAFAFTKFVTMLRNEELYAANVGDVNLDSQRLDYFLRNKQTGEKERHVTHLPPELVEILRPLTGRKPSAPLFHLNGRRLDESSLRKRFLRASERATAARRKIDADAPAVEIMSIGQFRHEAATIAMDELDSTKAVSDHLDHKDERTTRRHYRIRKDKAVLEQSKRVTEITVSKLVH